MFLTVTFVIFVLKLVSVHNPKQLLVCKSFQLNCTVVGINCNNYNIKTHRETEQVTCKGPVKFTAPVRMLVRCSTKHAHLFIHNKVRELINIMLLIELKQIYSQTRQLTGNWSTRPLLRAVQCLSDGSARQVKLRRKNIVYGSEKCEERSKINAEQDENSYRPQIRGCSEKFPTST